MKIYPEYFVSTDSIGLFGNQNQFLFLWKKYFENKTLNGVEMVAFKPISKLYKFISVLKENNVSVLSFHGKTGGEKQLNFSGRIIMMLVNLEICDIKILLKKFPEIEFLSHAPYFEENMTKRIIFQQQPNKIWIENHLRGKQGVEDAIKQINIYRENKIDAKGMLDIFHYVADYAGNLQTSWTNLVSELKSYILLESKNGQQLFTGIHFPIGNRLGDSLPIDTMTDQMLEFFAKEIIPNVKRVVFENQQNLLGLIFSTDEMLYEQKERNERIIERLKKTGIIISSSTT